jgi:integrase
MFNISYAIIVRKHILPQFGECQLNKIATFELQNFLNAKAKILANETVKKISRRLCGIFSAAMLQGLISSNPAIGLHSVKGAETAEKQVYTAEQTALITDFARTHRFGIEIILLLETGMRRGELLGLQWRDVNFNQGCIQIRRAVADVVSAETGKYEVVVGSTKNKSSVRLVPISGEVVSLLIIRHGFFCKDDNTEAFIVRNAKGNVCSPNTWSKTHYHRFMREMHEHYLEQNIDIPVLNPHECRHTRASELVNAGKNIYAVSKFLGHSDIKMLINTYAHSNVSELRRLLEM